MRVWSSPRNSGFPLLVSTKLNPSSVSRTTLRRSRSVRTAEFNLFDALNEIIGGRLLQQRSSNEGERESRTLEGWDQAGTSGDSNRASVLAHLTFKNS